MGVGRGGLTIEQRGAELHARYGPEPVCDLLWDCDGAVDLWDAPGSLKPNQVVHVANLVPAALVGSGTFTPWVDWTDSSGRKSLSYPAHCRSVVRAPE